MMMIYSSISNSTRYFKYRVLFDTEEYDKIPLKGIRYNTIRCVQGHVK